MKIDKSWTSWMTWRSECISHLIKHLQKHFYFVDEHFWIITGWLSHAFKLQSKNAKNWSPKNDRKFFRKFIKLCLGNQPLGGNTDQSLQTILQLLQLQNMAKNQGSMLPNNSTPTTPKSETECDVTDDQENAHLEVEETETNVENSDEKSTGKFFFRKLKNFQKIYDF